MNTGSMTDESEVPTQERKRVSPQNENTKRFHKSDPLPKGMKSLDIGGIGNQKLPAKLETNKSIGTNDQVLCLLKELKQQILQPLNSIND